MAFFKEEETPTRRFMRSFLVTFVAASCLAVLLLIGLAGTPRQQVIEPTLTQEEYVEELILLQQQIINHKEELIELYELKRLQEEGKLHSS